MKKIKKVLVLMTSMFVISSLSSCTGDDIAQLRNQISEIQNELTSIQNQISELQRKMDGDITSVKNDYNGKISTLLEKQTSLEIELNALQEELKKNKEELETELNSNIESLQKYFDDKISTLNSRISSDEAELTTLKTKHDNDVASLKADYEGKVSELNANITSTKQELQDDYNTKLNTLNEEFNTEMSSLQSDVEANKDKIDALQAKHDKDVSTLKTDYESSISELDEKLSKTEKVLQDDYNSKLDTLNTTYNAKCNALQADIDSCNASITSFKEQYEVDKKALEDDYVAKISALNEAFETRSSSIESSISKINEDISSLKEEMNTLIQEIQADYNDKISALSSRISSLEEKKTYQVYFYLDGNIIKQETVNEGDKIYVPSYELTKGYNISSWYTYDSGLRCPWSFSGCSVTSNIDLYADFTYQSYRVHFVDNKQGLSDRYQTVSYKNYYNFSTIYSKTGYTLTGFKDSDGNDFSISGYYTKTSGITLYANWSLNEYSITYNLDGGSIDSSLNPTSYSIESDTITLSNPSKEGYRFDGWYDGSKIVTSIKRGSIGNINLTARWSKYYSVNVSSSDTSKGSVEIISSQDKYCYKDSVTIKATSNNGYKFASWTNDGVVISTNSEYTFLMPSKDYDIVANFESPKNLSVSSEDESLGKASIINGSSSSFTNDTITVQATPSTNCMFKGWYDSNNNLVSSSSTYTFNMPSYDYKLIAKFYNEEETTKLKKDLGMTPSISDDGKTLTYGLYPQTYVSDTTTITALDSLTTTESNGWYKYNNEYYTKVSANLYSSNYITFSDGTEIESGTSYWFKCEPITWNILESNNGEYSLVSNVLLDAHRYNEYYSGKKNGYYANNYANSEIRTWLNNEFYNTAFNLDNSLIQTIEVDNSASTTDSSSNPYVCDNTNDKVYLLSYADYNNTNYFTDYDSRTCKVTDYALANGAYLDNSTRNGWYWTRSPYSSYSSSVWYVDNEGYIFYSGIVYNAYDCVRPALTIKIA